MLQDILAALRSEYFTEYQNVTVLKFHAVPIYLGHAISLRMNMR